MKPQTDKEKMVLKKLNYIRQTGEGLKNEQHLELLHQKIKKEMKGSEILPEVKELIEEIRAEHFVEYTKISKTEAQDEVYSLADLETGSNHTYETEKTVDTKGNTQSKPLYQKSFKELKDEIKTKKEGSDVKNIDTEKLKQNTRTTVNIIEKTLKGLSTVLYHIYKIPAKRHFKKQLDYNIFEVEHNYEGGDLKESVQEGNKILAHHFYVDYLPKIITIIGALILYYTPANTVGFVTLLIGLAYYFGTYITFNYGDSRILQHISDTQDEQGIRLKDSYYTNILAMHNYFNEYQQALKVSINERGKVWTEWDKDFGTLLFFTIKEDKNVGITSLSDHLITYYKIVPHIDEYQKKLKVFKDRTAVIMLDQILLEKIDRAEDISRLFSQKEQYYPYFTELQYLAEEERQRVEDEKRRQERAAFIEQARAKVYSAGINERAINILALINDKREEWNFNAWNIGQNGLKGNDKYVQIRCILNGGASVKDIQRKQHLIESKFRSQILLKPLQDKGSFNLFVLFEPELKKYALTCKDVAQYNNQDKIFIGQSITGPLTTEWNYGANHAVVGGKSGSGKSVQIINLLTQLSQLKTFKYTRMYLTSSSKIGDFVPFAKKGALVSSGVERQEQVFSYVLDKLEAREALFYKEGVSNIKEYNEKHPEKPMDFIILLADEWENSRGTLDGKLAKKLEGTLVSILNIARSSGCLVIIGAQSILKGDIGTVVDKMFTKYSGSNNRNVLNTISPEIAGYYATLEGKPQGVFFYSSENTPAEEESIYFGETNYTLIQTPYIKDITPKNLPELQGADEEDAILNGGSTASEIETIETAEETPKKQQKTEKPKTIETIETSDTQGEDEESDVLTGFFDL